MTVHLIADGHAVTLCCGRTPFELGRTARITIEASAETCTANRVAGAVAELDAIDGSDPEMAHGRADAVLLRFVPPEVREAYLRLSGDGDREGRAPWWATS